MTNIFQDAEKARVNEILNEDSANENDVFLDGKSLDSFFFIVNVTVKARTTT